MGITYVNESGQSIHATFAGGESGVGVRRRELRKALWRRARELGVEIIYKRAADVRETSEFVTVDGLNARYLCLATGSRDTLLRDLDLNDQRPKKSRPHRTGLRRHARVKPWSDMVEVYWSEFGELYVTPVSPEVVNIAILSWQPFTFNEAMNWFPAISAKLKDVTWDDSAAGVSPLAHRGRSLTRGRILLAGDAAGFLDAMTGEGNALALQSGIAVADVIAENSIDTYSARWRKITWRYWVMTEIGLWFTRPGMPRKFSLWVLFRLPVLLTGSLRFLSIKGH
jgi:flavin-dependent dehydrogenase